MSNSVPLISRLSSRVIRIMGLNPGPMTLDGTNTYLIGTGPRRILIDTGEGNPAYPDLLKQCLSQYQVTGISHIVITHRHPDHIGGLADILTNGVGVDQGGIKICKYIQRETESLAAIRKYLPRASQVQTEALNHGDVISCSGATLRVIYTPGHTNDHITLYLEEENSWFSADCILGRGSTTFEDLKSYMDSLKMIQQTEKNIQVIYPAHGEVIRNPAEKINEYVKHREERENQIFKVIQESGLNGITLHEIVSHIYPEIFDKPRLIRAASYSTSQHIDKLEKESRLSKHVVENHFRYFVQPQSTL
jgi:ribonuclease/clavin/mitogillin